MRVFWKGCGKQRCFSGFSEARMRRQATCYAAKSRFAAYCEQNRRTTNGKREPMENFGRENFARGETSAARCSRDVSGRASRQIGKISGHGAVQLQLLEAGGRGQVLLYRSGKPFQLRGRRVHAQRAAVGSARERNRTDTQNDVRTGLRKTGRSAADSATCENSRGDRLRAAGRC